VGVGLERMDRPRLERVNDLFLEGILEESQDPIRPLGKLSDFVVKELPMVLGRVRSSKEGEKEGLVKGLVEDVEALVEGVKEVVGDSLVKVAGLDIQMARHGILTSCGTVGLSLTRLAEAFNKRYGLPNTLTYDQIVLGNPPEDWRSFTRGRVGKMETDFYRAHQWAEEHLAVSVGLVFQARYAKNALERAAGGIRRATEVTATLNRLNTEDFDVFRPYLMGTSGFYSLGVVLVDLTLVGGRIPWLGELKKELPSGLFPQEDEISEAMLVEFRNDAVLDWADKLGDKGVYQAVGEALGAMGEFRRVHYEVVAAKKPEVAEDRALSTKGSMNAGQLLRERRDFYIHLAEEIKGKAA